MHHAHYPIHPSIQAPKPVMVIIDPRQRDSGIPTDAYFAVEEIKDVCPDQLVYTETYLVKMANFSRL